MNIRRVLMIGITVVALLIFLFLLFAFPTPQKTTLQTKGGIPGVSQYEVAPFSNLNVFEPPTLLSPATPLIEGNSGVQQPTQLAPASPSDNQRTTQLRNFEQKALSFIPPSGTHPPLELPPVSMNDLAIDSSGVKTVFDFAEYLALHGKNVGFDYGRMRGVIKSSENIPLMPEELVAKVLADNSFDAAKDSFLTLKEFIAAKISFEKSIKVTGDAVLANQNVIGMDELTLTLIDKALAVQSKTLSKQELEDYFNKYESTAEFYNREYVGKYAAPTFGFQKTNSLSSLLDALGILKIARAVGLGFGGVLSTPVICTCDPSGYSIIVGPPVAGNFYISLVTAATPSMRAGTSPGAWILGTYTPAAVCMQYVGYACVPGWPFPWGTVIIAGSGYGP